MYDINELTDTINRAITELPIPAEPAGLYDPIRYALDGGGKRLRPLLTLIGCLATGSDSSMAIDQAIGLEMFHNFTLLHDDVMDRAELRRGRPAVHCRWNESTAILSGDTMLTLATQLICKAPDNKLRAALALFNKTAIEVYEGQQYDMDFESRNDVTQDEYINMIRLKTSVLLGCACAMGVLMGGGDGLLQRSLYEYGVQLGLAFQLQDDLLDTYGDPIVFGKEIGGDIRNDKKTWLLITATAEAPGAIEAIRARRLDANDKIAAVKEVYDSLNLRERCGELVMRYSRNAIEVLEGLDITHAAKSFLTQLANNCANRNH